MSNSTKRTDLNQKFISEFLKIYSSEDKDFSSSMDQKSRELRKNAIGAYNKDIKKVAIKNLELISQINGDLPLYETAPDGSLRETTLVGAFDSVKHDSTSDEFKKHLLFRDSYKTTRDTVEKYDEKGNLVDVTYSRDDLGINGPGSAFILTKNEEDLLFNVKQQSALKIIQTFYSMYMSNIGIKEVDYRLGAVAAVITDKNTIANRAGQTTSSGAIFTPTNLTIDVGFSIIDPRTGKELPKTQSYANLFFPPYTLPQDLQCLEDGEAALLDDANYGSEPKLQTVELEDGSIDIIDPSTQEKVLMAEDLPNYSLDTLLSNRKEPTYRYTGFKVVNDNINMLQQVMEGCFGIVSTAMPEWDLSLYMQEGIVPAIQVSDDKKKKTFSYVTKLTYRMSEDAPKIVATSPNTTLQYATYGAVNAAVSAMHCDESDTPWNELLYKPDLSAYSPWWSRYYSDAPYMMVDPDASDHKLIKTVPQFWNAVLDTNFNIDVHTGGYVIKEGEPAKRCNNFGMDSWAPSRIREGSDKLRPTDSIRYAGLLMLNHWDVPHIPGHGLSGVTAAKLSPRPYLGLLPNFNGRGVSKDDKETIVWNGEVNRSYLKTNLLRMLEYIDSRNAVLSGWTTWDTPFWKLFYTDETDGLTSIDTSFDDIESQQGPYSIFKAANAAMAGVLDVHESEQYENYLKGCETLSEYIEDTVVASTDPSKSFDDTDSPEYSGVEPAIASGMSNANDPFGGGDGTFGESDISVMGCPIPGSALLKLFLKKSSIQKQAMRKGASAGSNDDGSSDPNGLTSSKTLNNALRGQALGDKDITARYDEEGHLIEEESLEEEAYETVYELGDEAISTQFSYGPGVSQYSPFITGGPHGKNYSPDTMEAVFQRDNIFLRYTPKLPTDEEMKTKKSSTMSNFYNKQVLFSEQSGEAVEKVALPNLIESHAKNQALMMKLANTPSYEDMLKFITGGVNWDPIAFTPDTYNTRTWDTHGITRDTLPGVVDGQYTRRVNVLYVDFKKGGINSTIGRPDYPSGVADKNYVNIAGTTTKIAGTSYQYTSNFTKWYNTRNLKLSDDMKRRMYWLSFLERYYSGNKSQTVVRFGKSINGWSIYNQAMYYNNFENFKWVQSAWDRGYWDCWGGDNEDTAFANDYWGRDNDDNHHHVSFRVPWYSRLTGQHFSAIAVQPMQQSNGQWMYQKMLPIDTSRELSQEWATVDNNHNKIDPTTPGKWVFDFWADSNYSNYVGWGVWSDRGSFAVAYNWGFEKSWAWKASRNPGLPYPTISAGFWVKNGPSYYGDHNRDGLRFNTWDAGAYPYNKFYYRLKAMSTRSVGWDCMSCSWAWTAFSKDNYFNIVGGRQEIDAWNLYWSNDFSAINIPSSWTREFAYSSTPKYYHFIDKRDVYGLDYSTVQKFLADAFEDAKSKQGIKGPLFANVDYNHGLTEPRRIESEDAILSKLVAPAASVDRILMPYSSGGSKSLHANYEIAQTDNWIHRTTKSSDVYVATHTDNGHPFYDLVFDDPNAVGWKIAMMPLHQTNYSRQKAREVESKYNFYAQQNGSGKSTINSLTSECLNPQPYGQCIWRLLIDPHGPIMNNTDAFTGETYFTGQGWAVNPYAYFQSVAEYEVVEKMEVFFNSTYTAYVGLQHAGGITSIPVKMVYGDPYTLQYYEQRWRPVYYQVQHWYYWWAWVYWYYQHIDWIWWIVYTGPCYYSYIVTIYWWHWCLYWISYEQFWSYYYDTHYYMEAYWVPMTKTFYPRYLSVDMSKLQWNVSAPDPSTVFVGDDHITEECNTVASIYSLKGRGCDINTSKNVIEHPLVMNAYTTSQALITKTATDFLPAFSFKGSNLFLNDMLATNKGLPISEWCCYPKSTESKKQYLYIYDYGITDRTKKDTLYVWTADNQRHYEVLRTAYFERPLLDYIKTTITSYLSTPWYASQYHVLGKPMMVRCKINTTLQYYCSIMNKQIAWLKALENIAQTVTNNSLIMQTIDDAVDKKVVSATKNFVNGICDSSDAFLSRDLKAGQTWDEDLHFDIMLDLAYQIYDPSIPGNDKSSNTLYDLTKARREKLEEYVKTLETWIENDYVGNPKHCVEMLQTTIPAKMSEIRDTVYSIHRYQELMYRGKNLLGWNTAFGMEIKSPELAMLAYMELLYHYRKYYINKRFNKQDGTYWGLRHIEKLLPSMISILNLDNRFDAASQKQEQNNGNEVLPIAFIDLDNTLADKANAMASQSSEPLSVDLAAAFYIKVNYLSDIEAGVVKKHIANGEISSVNPDDELYQNPDTGEIFYKQRRIVYVKPTGKFAILPSDGVWMLTSKEVKNEIKAFRSSVKDYNREVIAANQATKNGTSYTIDESIKTEMELRKDVVDRINKYYFNIEWKIPNVVSNGTPYKCPTTIKDKNTGPEFAGLLFDAVDNINLDNIGSFGNSAFKSASAMETLCSCIKGADFWYVRVPVGVKILAIDCTTKPRLVQKKTVEEELEALKPTKLTTVAGAFTNTVYPITENAVCLDQAMIDEIENAYSVSSE